MRVQSVCYRDISNVRLIQIIDEYWLDVVSVVSEYIPVSKDCLIKSKGNKWRLHKYILWE